MTRLTRNPVSWVVAANAGLFVWLTGGRILSPGHVSWLRVGDTASGYLGWEFFRRGPMTVWPPGASPLFGVGYASSIVNADAIPLLALPMKFVLAFTDVRFQYFGAWLLACFVLQGIFALKLLRRLGVSGPVLVPGALLFSIAPVFLYRMVTGGYGHMALAGHFLVLWALWLVLDPQLSHRRWAAVLLVSLLVQFYLFVMVGYFYVVAVCWWLWRQRRNQPWRVAGVGVLGNVVGVAMVAYLAGYFMGGSHSGEGFGQFRADALTLIDSSPFDHTGWSQVITDRITFDYTYEGYGYVGIAAIVLGFVGIGISLYRRKVRRLTIASIAATLPLALFALSNQITLGARQLTTIQLTSDIESVANVLRASGRFIWPLTYVLTASALSLFVVALGRYRIAAVGLVGFLVLAQMADQRKALIEFRERFTETRPVVTVRGDAEWERKLAKASCIAVYPTPLGDDRWQEIAEFALTRRKVTNAGYVSRWRPESIRDLDSRILESSALTDQYFDCAIVVYPRNSEERSAVVRAVTARRKDVFVAALSAPNVILIEEE